MKWFELKIPPLILTIVFLIDLAVVHWMYPDTLFTFPYHSWAGIICMFVGAIICALGVKEFRAADTTLNPNTPEAAKSLVNKGIYHYSRNPMYLGFLIILCGAVLFVANAITLMHPILFVFYLHYLQILPEERAMMNNFGEDYLQYMTKTRRWI